jgi:hypothetical protein
VSCAFNHDALGKLDERYARNNKSLPARMFVSYGSEEYSGFRDPIISFQKRLAARRYEGLALSNYAMQGLDHTSVKRDSYVRRLMWVWRACATARAKLTCSWGGSLNKKSQT